jgi:hypothetical protein
MFLLPLEDIPIQERVILLPLVHVSGYGRRWRAYGPKDQLSLCAPCLTRSEKGQAATLWLLHERGNEYVCVRERGGESLSTVRVVHGESPVQMREGRQPSALRPNRSRPL